jgi:16S rRNA (guanine(966)-N(2))-methyltransferase RsmD
MRIIGGKYKRRKLIASDDLSIRPAMDRVREFIFNVLQTDIPKAKILDIFAGSGSLGLESLSRGAEFAAFVDMNPKAIKAIEKNIENIKLEEAYQIFRQDAFKFVEHSPYKFDIIFCDPPYKMENFVGIIEEIVNNDLLNEDGVLLIEHYSKIQLPESFGNVFRFRDKKFGKTIISLYRKECNE